MKQQTNIYKIIVVALAVFIAYQSIAIGMSAKTESESPVDISKTTTDQYKTEGDKIAKKFSEKISTYEILGPLSAVSLSPFFGITCLSGASMFNMGEGNAFLQNNDTLSNPLVFIAFLGLTLLTSLPKLTTVTKAFAEVTDQVETYAGIISYLVIYGIANSQLGEQTNDIVMTAGVFAFTKQTLLMVACTANIIVINTVKYFFELLAFISPIPMLDAAFEVANKAVVAFLVAVYIFNPALSFVLNLVIFLICLVIFKWIRRRVKNLRGILLDPVWTGMVRNLFGFKNYDPDKSIRRKLAGELSGLSLTVKVFAAAKIKSLKYKKKQLLYLAVADSKVYLAKPRFLNSPIVKEFNVNGFTAKVEKGLISNSIEFTGSGENNGCKVTFSKVYTDRIDEISQKLNG